MLINIDSITLDHQAQPRVEINSEVVNEYAEAMQAGAKFPPVVVFRRNGTTWLADGWHRVYAAKKAGQTKIDAKVEDGNLRDAILFSCGVNSEHGVRRTNADKRRAVNALLADKEWQKRSDRWIAEQCKVDHSWVSDVRKQLLAANSSVNIEPRIGQDGKLRNLPIQPERLKTLPEDYGLAIVEDWDTGNPIVVDEDGNDYAPGEVRQLIDEQTAKPSKSHFNLTNDNIEWAAWSWNPVTGCEHDCPYCYARDIANRFYPQGFKPTFHPERLEAAKNTNPLIGKPGGAAVFVCSMADLFGDWVPVDWIEQVLQVVKDNPQWTFIFLTKNPKRLVDFEFPDNAWVGATVDTRARVKNAVNAMSHTKAKVKFFSCEPLLEDLGNIALSVVNWVIIGGQSRNSQCPKFQPEWDWVYKLTRAAYESDCKVYWKPNLTIRPREYPR